MVGAAEGSAAGAGEGRACCWLTSIGNWPRTRVTYCPAPVLRTAPHPCYVLPRSRVTCCPAPVLRAAPHPCYVLPRTQGGWGMTKRRVAGHD